MHANSVAAFRDLDLGKREALVLASFALSSCPLTDREVMERMGFAEPNSVRPRITALIERGLLYESRSVRCPTTGRTVRTCTTTSLAIGVRS